jgi:hypothetical protein
MGTGCLSTGVKRPGLKFITHLPIVWKLIMRRAVPVPNLYALMARLKENAKCTPSVGDHKLIEKKCLYVN